MIVKASPSELKKPIVANEQTQTKTADTAKTSQSGSLTVYLIESKKLPIGINGLEFAP